MGLNFFITEVLYDNGFYMIGAFVMKELHSEYKSNLADSTDWVSQLPSNLIEAKSPNTEALSANPRSFSFAWNSWKDKNDLGINALI